MRDDPHESAQHKLGDTISLVAIHDCFDPASASGVVRSVFAVRIHKHIHVGEDQF